jgi:polar amino acid transport system substrate-binding protein
VTSRRTLGAAALAATGLLATRAVAQQPAESTFDRVRRTGVVRIAALPGERPFFAKDVATGEWSGVAIDMARDIVKPLNARLEYVESTYANSVLDLQANKIDLAFALNPTPARALAIGFTRPYYLHPFGTVAPKGFRAKTWEDLNRPEVRAVSLLGALADNLLARYAPKATVIDVKTGDDAILTMQAGRGDCIVYALIQALSVSSRAPNLEQVTILDKPRIALPSAMGVQQEPDRRWRDYLDEWTDYNTGTGQIGAWIRAALLQGGIKAESIPSDAGF